MKKMIMTLMMVFGLSVSAFAKPVHFALNENYYVITDDEDNPYDILYGRPDDEKLKIAMAGMPKEINGRQVVLESCKIHRTTNKALEKYGWYWMISTDQTHMFLDISTDDGRMLHAKYLLLKK